MRPELLSDAIQDYIKEIYKLSGEVDRVTTNAVARRMGVSAPSVTSMLKKLAALGLVVHEPYRGATLTPAGERIAVEVVRHHRLLELYLMQTLGMSIENVHAEADRLEHALSEELEARIDAALGYPTHDPHGDPIPAVDLTVDEGTTISLDQLEPGQHGLFVRVSDSDPEMLRYLSGLGLAPGERLQLIRREPFEGPLIVGFAGAEHPLGVALAQAMRVEVER